MISIFNDDVAPTKCEEFYQITGILHAYWKPSDGV